MDPLVGSILGYTQNSHFRYEVYSIRWMVLLSVTLLNLSNNALWISYASVAPVSADYFDKDINTDIDLLSTISFYVGIPMCIISTYVVDAFGFKTGLVIYESLVLISTCYFPNNRDVCWNGTDFCGWWNPSIEHSSRPQPAHVPSGLDSPSQS